MENASKALLMAGGIMLTMLIVSLLLYGWTSLTEYQESQDRIKEVEDLAKFNQQFTNYERNDVQGYELLSLVNKVIDYNQRKASTGENSSSAAGNDSSYKPIDIIINMEGDLSNLRTSITIYKKVTTPEKKSKDSLVETTYSGEDYKLFDGNKFQINTYKIAQNLENILKEARDIENEKAVFGGATGIQNLVKNIATIYNAPIIRYNGYPTDEERTEWYDEDYIKSRYKTLTGVSLSIDNIRKKENVEKVLKYYEYTYFKKAYFKCTGTNYDSSTGRVVSMNFEYIGLE